MTPTNIYDGELENNSYRARSYGPAVHIFDLKLGEVLLLRLKKTIEKKLKTDFTFGFIKCSIIGHLLVYA